MLILKECVCGGGGWGSGNVAAARSRYEQAIHNYGLVRREGEEFVRALLAWGTLEGSCRKWGQARSLFKQALVVAEKVREVAEMVLRGKRSGLAPG